MLAVAVIGSVLAYSQTREGSQGKPMGHDHGIGAGVIIEKADKSFATHGLLNSQHPELSGGEWR
jgi:hypothetical protein